MSLNPDAQVARADMGQAGFRVSSGDCEGIWMFGQVRFPGCTLPIPACCIRPDLISVEPRAAGGLAGADAWMEPLFA